MVQEKKRGPKYPPGVGKRKVLLIALNHPDGVGEAKLINEIKEKLSLTNNRGIKGHLDDLGPGRTVNKEWEKGEQFLIKIPSKFEPEDTKKRVLKILKIQGEEIDINNLKEENFWKSRPSFAVLRYFLKEWNEDSFLFFCTKYMEKTIEEILFPLFGKQCGVINGYFENDEFVYLTQLERKKPKDIKEQKRKIKEEKERFLSEVEALKNKVEGLKCKNIKEQKVKRDLMWAEIKNKFLPPGWTHKPGEEAKHRKMFDDDPQRFILNIKEIKHPEPTLEEGVIEPGIKQDVLKFLKKGFKLSPTAIFHTLHDLPEVKIATALMLSAKPNYIDRGLSTYSIAIATLCSCLLIDMAKYPSLKDEIGAFFRDPDIAHTLTTWLDWDFLHHRLEVWIAMMYDVGKVFREC